MKACSGVVLLMFAIMLTGNLRANNEASPYEKAQAKIEASQKKIKHQKRKAEILEDEQLIVFFSSLEELLDLNAKCFDKSGKDELKAGLCIIQETQKLADNGNPVAQHSMGNIYEGSGDNPKAVDWYQKALDNPKTPTGYQHKIQDDMDRAKESQAREEGHS